jgi:hypothetical protein
MSSIRATRGNTVLTLEDSSLHVLIQGERFGPFAIDAQTRQCVWRGLQRIDLPLEAGAFGVGGTGSDVAIELGGARLSFAWWQSPPRGWDAIAAVFDVLATLVPVEVRRRYDVARGGE